MGVDATRKHVPVSRVENSSAVLGRDRLTDLDDLFAVGQDVGLKRVGRGEQRPVLDQQRHGPVIVCQSAAVASVDVTPKSGGRAHAVTDGFAAAGPFTAPLKPTTTLRP